MKRRAFLKIITAMIISPQIFISDVPAAMKTVPGFQAAMKTVPGFQAAMKTVPGFQALNGRSYPKQILINECYSTKQLKGTWTSELQEDLKTIYGVNLKWTNLLKQTDW